MGVMNRKKLALLALAASVISLGGDTIYAAAEKSANVAAGSARICKIYNIEVPVARNAGGQCVAPAYENEGGLCVSWSKAHNAFSYIIREDESIDFGLSFWFASGAHCGIIGNAKQTDTGWHYENNMDSENPAERCSVDIKIVGDHLTFYADPQASCRAECGAAAQLRGLMLPFSAIESRSVTPADLHPEKFFNTPCKPAPASR